MFDTTSERCLDCDGHFRHFPGCPDYVGEPLLTIQERVELYRDFSSVEGF